MSALDTAWETLDVRNQGVLEMRSAGFTLQDIASKLSVSRERVRQIETEALLHFRSLLDLTDSRIDSQPVALTDALGCVHLPSFLKRTDSDSEPAGITLLRVLGFSNVRAWGSSLASWFTNDKQSVAAALRLVTEEAPLYNEELTDVLKRNRLDPSLPSRELLSAQTSPLILDVNGAWIRRSKKNRDSAYLWLRTRLEPGTTEEICSAIGASSIRAVAELLRRNSDTFTQVRPEGSWALVDWSNLGIQFDYRDATEAVLGVLRERGPLSKLQLTAETLRRYPVSVSRVIQCLSSRQVGTTEDGLIDLAERGARHVIPQEPKCPAQAARSGETLALRMPVTKDVLRGSSIGVTPWLTWQLGLHFYPSSVDFSGSFPLTLRRNTSGSSVSTLREAAINLGVTLGCELLLMLDREHLTVEIRHACTASCDVVPAQRP